MVQFVSDPVLCILFKAQKKLGHLTKLSRKLLHILQLYVALQNLEDLSKFGRSRVYLHILISQNEHAFLRLEGPDVHHSRQVLVQIRHYLHDELDFSHFVVEPDDDEYSLVVQVNELLHVAHVVHVHRSEHARHQVVGVDAYHALALRNAEAGNCFL